MIFDQIGRATFQFSVVLSAIASVIDTALEALGINPPAVFSIPYFNGASLLSSIHGYGATLYAIAVFAIFAGHFLISLISIYVTFFGALGAAASQAFGIPAFYSLGIAVGSVLQVFMYYYVIALIYNYASQSPFFNSPY